MSKEKPQVIKAKVGFFKLFFTSCLGTVIGLGALIAGGIYMGVAAKSANIETIKPNTVLKLQFNKPVPELTNNVAEDQFDVEGLFKKNLGLNDICKTIELASEDDNIKGIYLEMEGVPVGWATSKVLRNQLNEFKAKGKFITAYSKYYTQKSYYLASTADSIYLHPQGAFSFTGFAAQLMYFKGLMDKMGVTAQIFYAGKFKSATEPFRRKNMTEPNRKQVTAFLSGMYDIYLEELATSRGVTADELYRIADGALIRKPIDAVNFKMVDGLKYKDEIIDQLRSDLGTAKDDEIEVATIEKYYGIHKEKLNESLESNKVAVVYAEGSIVDGQGEKGSIGGDKYAAVIRKIRKDENVKAIVLRVNSGGGSALASDIIWRELEMAKKQGIRVVTSMGDVAASGGYYIASNSDKIFAENNTITGSIGVFGMIPNMRGLYEDHLGLTMDTVKIGKFSLMSNGGGTFYEFNEAEKEIIQSSVDDVYTVFKTRVSDGRSMSMAEVDSVAQGRVWLGNKAQTIGLVDELGGLQDAIKAAAELASVESYRTVDYPKTKSFEEKLADMLSGNKDDGIGKTELLQEFKESMTGTDIEELRTVIDAAKTIKEMKGVQVRLPYQIDIQ
jgi:protease-4